MTHDVDITPTGTPPMFAGHASHTRRRPVMAMRWSELLFAHWPVDAEALRTKLPEALRPHLDTFEGKAWLGVVPFVMSRVRGLVGSIGLPAVPGLSRFPELNLRTYVNVDGVPGVWFFSLDAHHRIAVRTARLTFGLPYFNAHMRCTTHEGDCIDYRSRRTHRSVPAAEFDATYQATGPALVTQPGTLEHFLTSRYCLFSQRRGKLLRGDITHEPWRLRPASCELRQCDMTRLIDMPLPQAPPHLLFAEPLDVRAWWPRSVS
ncbi:MAG: DUF2071 domain-containing protein [Planctomycetota bacterium]